MADSLHPLSGYAPSQAARLTYVLRHLYLAYPTLPAVSIGYAATQPQVEVVETSEDFFEGQHPYPAAPGWREWRGQRLPFFFDPQPEQPLIKVLPTGKVTIQADVLAAAFYLLSGWQEYFSPARDQHGRFPYAASVQQQYGFVALPVVNYYFDVLKTAVEHLTGQPCPPRRWGGAPFAAFITHDVDNLFSAWKAPVKAALRRRDWRTAGRHLWRHFTQKDAWNNLVEVRQTVAGYGAKSTFFFLANHRKAANGTPNADYRLSRLGRQLTQLRMAGSEIQLHGSIGSATSTTQLRHEAARLAGQAGRLAVRFHYLCWEPRATPTLLDESAVMYDSTLGFAEHYGFRNSYCLPFYPFDFGRGTACAFLEIPLNVMDATLYHPRYLQLPPEQIRPALTPMLREIEQFGGVCTVLWHNENFDPANDRNGPRQFRELLEELRSRGVAFLTGPEIYAALDVVEH